MKVKIEKIVDPENSFTPYSVTFDITTKEQSSMFHDNVAIRLCQGPHEFLGSIFNRGRTPDMENEEFDI